MICFTSFLFLRQYVSCNAHDFSWFKACRTLMFVSQKTVWSGCSILCPFAAILLFIYRINATKGRLKTLDFASSKSESFCLHFIFLLSAFAGRKKIDSTLWQDQLRAEWKGKLTKSVDDKWWDSDWLLRGMYWKLMKLNDCFSFFSQLNKTVMKCSSSRWFCYRRFRHLHIIVWKRRKQIRA